MRYHFGFGVGHVYSRRPATGGSDYSESPERGSRERDMEGELDKEAPDGDGQGPCGLDETVHMEPPELEESSSDDSTDDDKDSQDDPTDDDELYALDEMYGPF
jgi:hypothetical protein